ncbi:type II RES/Xre toxin-antitoxin system antitoxin [Hymenobacter psychrophilus]|uniref:Putative toxin-antitoxin system antitoxin component, TIGR02293 family n=1 Tax=Hymenobacter psychrophilus TaxID=651662 RepID=A0A1H3NBZ9_9BACT|nr:antitoxin Xre-like helix-turn-helix domain-containing protein [Hymenobacter psychrophilus]SDY86200.1 putative toxin-antitoxin system antitoxin component, TIGR02293 family [Hymenobacter psychrophilus]
MTMVRNTSITEMVALMGGPAVIPQLVRNEMDLLGVAIKGLSVQAVRALQRHLGFSNKEMSAVLGVSESTLTRREQNHKPLTLDESEKAIQLSAVLAKGMEVFEEEADLHFWLNSPIPALGGQKPKDLLYSVIGRGQVHDILGRIEHGHFS